LTEDLDGRRSQGTVADVTRVGRQINNDPAGLGADCQAQRVPGYQPRIRTVWLDLGPPAR
jgi:hypothetical protein